MRQDCRPLSRPSCQYHRAFRISTGEYLAMYDERDGNTLKNRPLIDMNIVYKNAPKFFLLGSLVAVIIVMTLLNSRFLTLGNIINISRHMSINMIIAVGMIF